jgi:predicted metal-dependent HD superfamily phosphohydrolase
MTTTNILLEAQQHVTELLREGLTLDHRFHDLDHTLAVRDAAWQLAQAHQLGATDQEILQLAALFHDTGYVQTYIQHEVVSCQLASAFLTARAYPADQLQQVLDCILTTSPNKHPQHLLEQIMRDADYVNLAAPDYLKHAENLRHEWAVFLNQRYTDAEWNRLNYDFFKQHQYFTPAARSQYEPAKKANSKHLKQLVKKVAKETRPEESIGIADSRSAQMMFKTSLRNHLDLSNLADNKANMMLSVNALIITVAIPMVATYMRNAPYLIYPMVTLILSCLSSMIFATLATRPIRMEGRTTSKQLESGQANLFFFGNFFRMSFEEYREGMRTVVSRNVNLENAIMRDLFFLGKSLGNKYKQLRVCYNVFVFGMMLTVVVFAICYAWWS